MIRGLCAGGSVRVVAATTTDLSREAAQRHGAVGGMAVALSRAATSGLLLATITKGGERVVGQILGDGPLGGVTVDADDSGRVRVYAHREVLIPGGSKNRVLLDRAIGRGVVNVIRDLGLKDRYTGQSPIVTGEIDEDFETYLRTSEQIESALGCEAVLSDSADVATGAGILLQCMPGGEGQSLVREIQHFLRTRGLYDLLVEDPTVDAESLAIKVLASHVSDLDVLDLRPATFFCSCSQERVEETLFLLGDEELSAMIREDGKAEVRCHFCAQKYEIPAEGLSRISRARQTSQRGSS